MINIQDNQNSLTEISGNGARDQFVQRVPVTPEFIENAPSQRAQDSVNLKKLFQNLKYGFSLRACCLNSIGGFGVFVGAGFLASQQYAVGAPLLAVGLPCLAMGCYYQRQINAQRDNHGITETTDVDRLANQNSIATQIDLVTSNPVNSTASVEVIHRPSPMEPRNLYKDFFNDSSQDADPSQEIEPIQEIEPHQDFILSTTSELKKPLVGKEI